MAGALCSKRARRLRSDGRRSHAELLMETRDTNPELLSLLRGSHVAAGLKQPPAVVLGGHLYKTLCPDFGRELVCIQARV